MPGTWHLGTHAQRLGIYIKGGWGHFSGKHPAPTYSPTACIVGGWPISCGHCCLHWELQKAK